MSGKLNAIASMYNGLRASDPGYTKALADDVSPRSHSADELLEMYNAAKRKEEEEEGIMNPEESMESEDEQKVESALGLEKHMKSGMPIRKK